jgi:hypothetical protein
MISGLALRFRFSEKAMWLFGISLCRPAALFS